MTGKGEANYKALMERVKRLNIDENPYWKTIPIAAVGPVIRDKEEREQRKAKRTEFATQQVKDGCKLCPGCMEIKPLPEFNNCKKLTSGKRSRCRTCEKIEAKARYKKSKE